VPRPAEVVDLVLDLEFVHPAVPLVPARHTIRIYIVRTKNKSETSRSPLPQRRPPARGSAPRRAALRGSRSAASIVNGRLEPGEW
jgi:hypothetical protein